MHLFEWDNKKWHQLSRYSFSKVLTKTIVSGPLGLPFLGYIPFLEVRNLGRSFKRLSKRYGDIFSIFLGNRHVQFSPFSEIFLVLIVSFNQNVTTINSMDNFQNVLMVANRNGMLVRKCLVSIKARITGPGSVGCNSSSWNGVAWMEIGLRLAAGFDS